MRGWLIVIEGAPLTGKAVQAKLLKDYLSVVSTRKCIIWQDPECLSFSSTSRTQRLRALLDFGVTVIITGYVYTKLAHAIATCGVSSWLASIADMQLIPDLTIYLENRWMYSRYQLRFESALDNMYSKAVGNWLKVQEVPDDEAARMIEQAVLKLGTGELELLNCAVR